MKEITWEQLSAEEQEALKGLGSFCLMSDGTRQSLIDKGLAEWVKQDQFLSAMLPTNLGKRVLAQADSGKPTTITAKQFVDEGYAAKIAAGECVVFDITPNYQAITIDHLRVDRIGTSRNGEDVVYWKNMDGMGYFWGYVNDQTKFSIEWLPDTPATVATEGGA